MAEGIYKPNSDEIIYQIIDGEYILLNLTNGNYFSLDNLGVFVWECVINSVPAGVFTGMIAGIFPGSGKSLAESAGKVFKELLAEGLSVPCYEPMEDCNKILDDFKERIASGGVNLSPVILHSYKNIQEKYAHPCGVKEI